MCNLIFFLRWWLHDCCNHNEDGGNEMFQNESEETEGREKKGTRQGVLRCGYCVKQGNVVSAQLLITDYSVFE